MTKLHVFILLGTAIIIAGALIYHALKNAPEIEESAPKFQPRNVQDFSKPPVEENDAIPPKKKKHYRKNYKKKPIDGVKKPVGRPKKSE